jgi:glycosyltransferase involved in cell wall biosynthesis
MAAATPRDLMVLGVGPLPHEAAGQVMAPGLRLDAFARKLAAEGHRVTVGRGSFEQVTLGSVAATGSAVATGAEASPPYQVFDLAPRGAATLRRRAAEAGADAVVALTDIMARTAIEARLPIPLCVDTYGDPIAERQMQAYRVGDDEPLWDGFTMMLPVLLGADRFTVCSEDHHSCLLGQLGMVGRLNRHTAVTSLVDVVRPSWPFASFPGAGHEEADQSGTLDPLHLADDAVVLLWAGGYNNWTDVDTLFTAVEAAMEQTPALVFVSAGGAIPGHSERTYARLEERVGGSARRDRWHLLGWRPAAEMPRLYARADVAVNIDAPGVEGRFGSRSRLLDWAHFGVATVTTTSSELAREMAAAGAAAAFEVGDGAGLAAHFARLAADAESRRALVEAGHRFLAEWDARAFPASFLAWAANPIPAPDLPSPDIRPDLAVTLPHPDNRLGALMNDLRLSEWMREWREDRGSRLYRAYRGARSRLISLKTKRPRRRPPSGQEG